LTPSRDADWPVTDFPLALPFLKLSISNVLQVLAALLTQRRLVFVSLRISLLTPAILAFLALLLPFRWLFTLVPLLPKPLLEFVAAPGVFIMGCSSKYKLEVKELLNEDASSGAVIVDLDLNEVTLSADSHSSLPQLPTSAGRSFQDSLQVSSMIRGTLNR
jgi:hypothetical protein